MAAWAAGHDDHAVALEIDLCASILVGEVFAVEDRRRAPDELLAEASELREECRVDLDLHVCIEHSLHDRYAPPYFFSSPKYPSGAGSDVFKAEELFRCASVSVVFD